MEAESFDIHKDECPWHSYGDCTAQVTFNGHVNDPKYGRCEHELCPFMYWKLIEEIVEG